jgi:hypothetical protein
VPAASRFATVLGGYQKKEYTQMGSVRVVLKVHSLKIKEQVLIYQSKKFSLR